MSVTNVNPYIYDPESEVSLNDVAGCEYAKNVIQEHIVLPLKFPGLFKGSRANQSQHFLIYGPPGVGKSLFSRAACNTSLEAVRSNNINLTLYKLNTYELNSRWHNNESMVREIFTNKTTPCIIIIDELENLFYEHESTRRVKTELLYQLRELYVNRKHKFQDISEQCWVMCITTEPWKWWPSLKGKIDKFIPIELPCFEARVKLCRSQFLNVEHQLTQLNLEEMAIRVKGFSGSDIVCFCKHAMMEPVKRIQETEPFKTYLSSLNGKKNPCESDEDIEHIMDNIHLEPITMNYCIKSIECVKPSITTEEIIRYKAFTKDRLVVGIDQMKRLQLLCSKVIGEALYRANPIKDIQTVLNTEIPVPKQLRFMVLNYYAEQIPP